jgi:SAM-dependent methyltransferase
MADVTPDPILQVASGFRAAKYLFVANEVGLFEQLAAGPATLDALAQRTGIPPRTLRILADAMVALGFVEQQHDQYHNSPVAATFLGGRGPADLRPFLRYLNQQSYPMWMELEAVVRTGRTSSGHVRERRTEAQQQMASEGHVAASAATAHALATTYDFRRHRRVLDLGGGTGSYVMAVCTQYRGLEAILYDIPRVAALARQRLAASPCAERIRIVEGNFFQDPIPDGCDAVIIANVVHVYSPERNMELLGRIRKRVPEGARLLLVDLWTDRTRTQPLAAALAAGEFLISSGGEGNVYSEEDVRGWLQESGWRAVEHKPLAGPRSLIIADTAEA